MGNRLSLEIALAPGWGWGNLHASSLSMHTFYHIYRLYVRLFYNRMVSRTRISDKGFSDIIAPNHAALGHAQSTNILPSGVLRSRAMTVFGIVEPKKLVPLGP